MKSNNLTIKQEAFCQKYIETGDASKSYREVYNTSKMKDKSVWELSSKLLKNIKVSSRIEELKGKVNEIAEKKFNITHEEILNHLNILRNARIDEYVEYVEVETPVTTTTGTGKNQKTQTIIQKSMQMKFKTFDQLTKEQLMCIESIKQDRYGNIELKLHGKDWTIDKINKHIGFYEKNNEQRQPTININSEYSDSDEKRLQELKRKLLSLDDK